MVTVNEAHQNTAGPYTVEASIPMNFFTEGNFKITFAGVTVDLADIEVLDGSVIKEDTTEAVYEGITIDGSFKDWDAVARYNAACLMKHTRTAFQKQLWCLMEIMYTYT